MKGTIPTNSIVIVLIILFQASCGATENADEQNADQGSGMIEAMEAINDMATPPVPTAVIHDARDAAAAANAHVETVDSILGSQ